MSRGKRAALQLGLDVEGASRWIQVMAERLAQQFEPLQVTLFGSYARGDQRPGSDVDLLVILPAAEDKHRAVAAIQRALADIPVPKDVVVTTPAELDARGGLIGSILRPALQEGRVLYRKEGWEPKVGSDADERLASTREWLRYASDDLQFAEATHREVNHPPRYVCCLAQQSAEKALKAVLVFDQADFPRTHNVTDLVALVPEGWSGVKRLAGLETLSSWSVQARYPDANRDATREEAEMALAQARAVWDAVSADLVTRGITLRARNTISRSPCG